MSTSKGLKSLRRTAASMASSTRWLRGMKAGLAASHRRCARLGGERRRWLDGGATSRPRCGRRLGRRTEAGWPRRRMGRRRMRTGAGRTACSRRGCRRGARADRGRARGRPRPARRGRGRRARARAWRAGPAGARPRSARESAGSRSVASRTASSSSSDSNESNVSARRVMFQCAMRGWFEKA